MLRAGEGDLLSAKSTPRKQQHRGERESIHDRDDRIDDAQLQRDRKPGRAPAKRAHHDRREVEPLRWRGLTYRGFDALLRGHRIPAVQIGARRCGREMWKASISSQSPFAGLVNVTPTTCFGMGAALTPAPHRLTS